MRDVKDRDAQGNGEQVLCTNTGIHAAEYRTERDHAEDQGKKFGEGDLIVSGFEETLLGFALLGQGVSVSSLGR